MSGGAGRAIGGRGAQGTGRLRRSRRAGRLRRERNAGAEEQPQRCQQRSRARRTAAFLALLGVVALGCAGAAPTPAPDLVAAAIAARGGPIEGFTRESRLLVHYGFPGRWHWEVAFQRPDRFRLALRTTGDEQSFVSDGETLRTYLGSALVAEEPAGGACTRSLARWLAVVTLDELQGPHYRWRSVDPEGGPADAAHALRVECRADASRYRLWLDADLRVIAARGPISIPTLGDGRLEARFSEHRVVDGRRVAFRIDYRLDGQPFVEETVVVFERGAPQLEVVQRALR